MVRGKHYHFWLALLFGGLLAGCGQMRPLTDDSEVIDYTVSSGDTLYSIAWRYGYDPREVAAWNNISAPFLLHPGDHIYIIPPDMEAPRSVLPRDRVAADSGDTGDGDSSASADVPVTAPVAAPNVSGGQSGAKVVVETLRQKVEKTYQRLKNSTVHWVWPTSGEVLNGYAPANGKKGLDIKGKIGQPIKAAAGGTVVYSGSGLTGYGKLVIIKHNDTYLSAYGHNRNLLVKEGTTVKQGEKIAEMGDSGKEGVMLHFEIRRNGKPVDPLSYLPRRGS